VRFARGTHCRTYPGTTLGSTIGIIWNRPKRGICWQEELALRLVANLSTPPGSDICHRPPATVAREKTQDQELIDGSSVGRGGFEPCGLFIPDRSSAWQTAFLPDSDRCAEYAAAR
jgi:hypothetical protein